LNIITDHLDIWTAAKTPKKAGGRGRGANTKKSPHGIKKLRELILELAVRGKLVPQDSNDEPASVLLEKIASEKERLIKEKKVKNQKALPKISSDEISFVLPKGWEWVRFGEIAQHNSGKTLDRGRNSGELREYITTSNLYWGRFELKNVRKMPIRDEELEKCMARKGDLLICEGGEAGRAAVWPFDNHICFQNHVHRTRFYSVDIDPYFGYRFFEKLNATGEIDHHRKGVGISNMSGKALASIAFPLPPHEEQHRIVAKVDELMALCDVLEQEQTDSSGAHQTLVETLLGTLTQAKDHHELGAAWSRIAEHFDTLFTTEQSIDQLKQTILQLAVMGKLVPQDPNDEPASELLKKIAAEKEQLIKEKKIKKQKPLPPINEDEKPFELPIGWRWARLQEIVSLLGDGLHGTPEYSLNEKYYFVNGNNLKNGKVVIKPETKTVAQDQYDKYKKGLCENTVLVSINGTLGNVAFYNNEDIVLGKSACYFNLSEIIYKQFIKVIIESPRFLEYAFKNATGSTIKNLGLKAMNNLPIALPPSVEQHRIVAKVDELMSLCDNLKERLKEAQTTQVQLADAIVEQAVWGEAEVV